MHANGSSAARATRWWEKPWLPAVGVAFVAIAVRLAHHAAMQAHDPFYGLLWPGGDNFVWDRWALEIAQTFWLEPERLPFWQGPLYPYALGFVYLRFGHDYTAAFLAQHVLGALTAALVADLARRAFSMRAAWLAGIGAAACPLFLLYEGEILSDSLILFLHVLLLWTLFRAADLDRRRDWAAAGIVLGLACLARPNALVLLPLILAWGAWTARDRRCAKLALLGLCMAACIAPATLANTLIGGRFALITVNGPINLYIGNSHDARGDYSRSDSYRAIIEASDRHEHDIDYTPHLIASIRAHPWSLPRNMAWKTRLFWQRMEIPHNVSFVIKRQFSPWLQSPLTWGWIGPLGVAGIALAFRPRPVGLPGKQRTLLLGYLLCYAASVILVFVIARFRLPAMAILLIFAACTIDRMLLWLDAWRSGQRRAAYPFLVTLAACGMMALSMAPPASMGAARWNDYYNLGGAYEEKGDYAAAVRAYEEALRLMPGALVLERARDQALEQALRTQTLPTTH